MATPSVATDTFICGLCQTYFSSLIQFIEHKKDAFCSSEHATGTPEDESANRLYEAVAESAALVSMDTSKLPASLTAPTDNISKKKRGRPRKAFIDSSESPATTKEKSFTIADNGSFVCNLCKISFKRERHYTSHKCEALGDYVNISKKDSVEELEEGFSSHPAPVDQNPTESDLDETEDFEPTGSHQDEQDNVDECEEGDKQPVLKKRKIVNNPVKRLIVNKDMSGSLVDAMPKDTEGGKRSNETKVKKQPKAKDKIIATYPIPQSLDDIPDVPVFKTVEEKLAFEERNICSIDVVTTDTMYKTHVIEQTMNENALPLAPRSHAEISLYSCNLCDKVFKSLSHIRLHCVVHLDSKPFKCPQEDCDFKTNSKGNVYSHMRKHTGQYYRCRSCDFKSVNKTHLLEHEATHSGVIHKCALCKKSYSTLKSLTNHIRKYHMDTKEGKEYMAQFVATKEGPGAALLYECHICDRKFKKQSDRDRHLYVHNVRVEHTVYTCELCQYEAARPGHLEGHFAKHKYVYGCAWCPKRCATTNQLIQHIQEHNVVEEGETSNQLLHKCIETSLYLPKKPADPGDDIEPENEDEPPEDEFAPRDLYKKLGFQPMTKEMFRKIQEELGTFECSECGDWFKTEELKLEHEKLHDGEKPYSCTYCNHKTYSKNSLKLHVNANHEDNLFMCGICNFTGKTKLSLYEHKQKHEEIECPICKLSCQGKKMLRNHLLLKHGEVGPEEARKLSGYGRRTENVQTNQTYRCPYCERTFLHNNSELQKHIWMHEGIKPYKCGICDHSCRTRSNLTSHMLKHTESKPFDCSFCGKKYKSKTALRWHERAHTDGKVFKCNRCNYEAMQRSHLKRHMEVHDLMKRFACNHCDFSANTIGYMRIHYTRFHPGLHYNFDPNNSPKDGMGAASGTKVFKCVSCDFLFGNMSDMKRHLKMRHRIQMSDMRNMTASAESVTQIVPLENQDGITSDVQVIQLPVDDSMVQQMVESMPDVEQSSSLGGSILVSGNHELNPSNLQQLVDFATQQANAENGDQPRQIVLNYQVAGETSNADQITTITHIPQTSTGDIDIVNQMQHMQAVQITGADNSIQTVHITGPDNTIQAVQIQGADGVPVDPII